MDGMGQAVRSPEAKLDALYRLGQRLILLRDEQKIVEAVLEIAEEVLEFQDSEFLLVDEAARDLVVVAQRGEFNIAPGLRLPLDGERGITVAAARSGQPVCVADVRADPRYVYAGFPACSEVAVPVQIEGQVLGVINVESREPDAFTSADVRLLSTLAFQAALALENARLYARERRRAEEMAAINRIARRITAALDLRETLDVVVEAAAEVVPCVLAEISLWDEERQLLTLQALRCEPDRVFPIGKSYPPGKGYTGWVVRNRQPLLVPDVEARQDIRPDLLPGERPFKAYVGLPLLAGDELIGTLVLIHDRANAFDEEDLRLLEALAGQAAVAIRNARLYEETTRRHRELAALNAVAEALNQPLDLQTLLAKAVERVIEVTGADAGGIRLLDPQTGTLKFVFSQGLSPEYEAIIQSVRLGEGTAGRVALTGEPVLIPDMLARPSSRPQVRAALIKEGLRARAEIPLRSREQVVGTMGLASRTPGAFGAADLELLTAIGHQIGVAIANAQLFEETQRKARRLAALNAVASVINQPLPLQEMMDQAVDKVIEVMEADAGGVRLLDPATEELVIVSCRGLSPEYIRQVDRLRVGEGIVGRVVQSGEPVVVEDMARDPRVETTAAALEGFHTFAVVPLRTREEIVGTLGVVTRQRRAFTAEELDLLMAIGHQIGVAIENDRLRQQALEAERLAAVGRIAGTLAHDLRGPLGGIVRSAEFLARPELSDATRQKLSRAIVAMARRLINTAQEILDFTRGGRMALHPVRCNLPAFLDEVLDVLRVDFSDQGIEVTVEWGYTGEVWMDPDRMAQVVYNIAANARDAMPEGGCLTVATRRVEGWVEMRFTDTGPGVPPELVERIFEPFFSYGKREGAGLGLSIARRIVREHGGEIEVESPAGGGATFVVRLPLGAGPPGG
jgi:GAF domain-containing protein